MKISEDTILQIVKNDAVKCIETDAVKFRIEHLEKLYGSVRVYYNASDLLDEPETIIVLSHENINLLLPLKDCAGRYLLYLHNKTFMGEKYICSREIDNIIPNRMAMLVGDFKHGIIEEEVFSSDPMESILGEVKQTILPEYFAKLIIKAG